MTHCVVCNVDFSTLALPKTGNRRRKVCPSAECYRKYNLQQNELRRKRSIENGFIDSDAFRTQGLFRVPSTQTTLCKKFTGEFFCWSCHKMHGAQDVSTLRLECPCGALYTLSLGETPVGVAIVRVDRWR